MGRITNILQYVLDRMPHDYPDSAEEMTVAAAYDEYFIHQHTLRLVAVNGPKGEVTVLPRFHGEVPRVTGFGSVPNSGGAPPTYLISAEDHPGTFELEEFDVVVVVVEP